MQPSRRIADDLRRAIASGELAEGAKLPSERVLATQYQTARNTVRAAVQQLNEEGLVTVQHGRGAFVRRKRKLLRFGGARYSHRLREDTGLSPYRAEVAKQGRTAHVDCTSITRTVPPPEVADRLGLRNDDDSVIRRENWYYADDEPVQVGVTFIPWGIAAGSVLADSADMGRGSLYARFAELGHTITRTREEIGARMPTPSEAERLAIPPGVPVIDVTHTGIDQHREPFEVTIFTMRADLTALDYEMPVED